MAAEAALQVLDRTMTDEAFLDQFLTNPDAALDGYDLTPTERDALLSGDEHQLREYLGELALEVAVAVVVVAIF